MSKRISFTAAGRVQGVNFRYYTAREANKLGVTGFVRNENDGTVKGEAQGSDDNIEQFVKIIKEGPPLAVVRQLDTTDMDPIAEEIRFKQERH